MILHNKNADGLSPDEIIEALKYKYDPPQQGALGGYIVGGKQMKDVKCEMALCGLGPTTRWAQRLLR